MLLYERAAFSKLRPRKLAMYSFRLIAAISFVILCSGKSALAGEVAYCSDIWDDDSGGNYGNIIACGITDVSYVSWKYHDASVETWLTSPSGVRTFDTASGEPYETYKMITVSLFVNFDSPEAGSYSVQSYHFSVCPQTSWGTARRIIS